MIPRYSLSCRKIQPRMLLKGTLLSRNITLQVLFANQTTALAWAIRCAGTPQKS
jgi:hypothetical protein